MILTKRKYSFKNTHYHLIYSVTKTTFKREEPKKLIFRIYSNFSQKNFQSDLLLHIRDEENNYLESAKKIVETLDKHAPKKIQFFRGNHKSHINKSLRHGIMKHSQLKSKANKIKDPKDIDSIKNNVIMWLN